jgi:hypothetical protein
MDNQTQEALKMAGYELDGVIADVEKFDGFDDVCLQTIKRVRSVIDEALEAEQEPFGIYHVGDTEEESDFFLFKDSGDVSCEKCIKLYTHPAQPWQEVKDTIFSNYNENISKQVWNTKSGLEGTQFEITDDLK